MRQARHGILVATLLSLAPEYELTVLDAADYRAGALANVDLLVQPGGGCRKQYENLGTNGVEALRRYVTGGGRYYAKSAAGGGVGERSMV